MGKKDPVPDAWDDEDWEAQADKLDSQPQQPNPQAPLSKAERLARHAESNRKLWEEADAPAPMNFLDSQPAVPLASGFKPQVKVLSRKPAPQMIARRDPVTGVSQLSLADDDADDKPEKKPQLTPEENRARQQREFEEKQRRYEEARARLFGESNPSSGASSPGAVTPPRGSGDGGRGNQRGRGRGRGGAHRGNSSRQEDSRRPGSRHDVGRSDSGRELFDPSYSPRGGGVSLQRRGGDSGQQSGQSTPRDDNQPKQAIRAPRGPDGSGRGGFGFAKRGTKEG
ncbi:hypothetical protein CkaCkLH20_02743 [Colletotrichum karsti]|uniref:SUZ domain-containing protein n=1 Tax=Colletotrichum karsti TaxID=1095194 RepID=A0A9P6LPR7_9PEZI|nr:uncharacterized protein CkaCkLH20_02743 [Colletotrichum karsti]KAF9879932.1 hypothetical protein CkaCkLH20_02743 [Colletotrichum karsti]